MRYAAEKCPCGRSDCENWRIMDTVEPCPSGLPMLIGAEAPIRRAAEALNALERREQREGQDDLTLVPMRALVAEIEARSRCSIVASLGHPANGAEPNVRVLMKCDPGAEWELIGLAAVAKDDVLMEAKTKLSKPPAARGGA